MLMIIIIEMSMYSYNAYNYVYDKSHSIKTLMYSHKITMMEYFCGKFLSDIII